MFLIATVVDTLKLTPEQYESGDSLALISAINAKYPERVLMDVGLVMTLYDIVKVGSSLIHPADGGAHFEVVFRLVVFKPHVGEVITGKVSECTSLGIKVSLDFFTNIQIPYYHLFEPSHFDEAKKTWIWDDKQEDEDKVDGDEEEENEPLAIKKGDMINFSVHDVNFTGKTYSVKGVHTMESKTDVGGVGPPVRRRSQSFDKGKSWEEGGNLRTAQTSNSTSMEVIGVMSSDGLGKNEWWENDEDDEDEE